jgi:hypothetical protein
MPKRQKLGVSKNATSDSLGLASNLFSLAIILRISANQKKARLAGTLLILSRRVSNSSLELHLRQSSLATPEMPWRGINPPT